MFYIEKSLIKEISDLSSERDCPSTLRVSQSRNYDVVLVLVLEILFVVSYLTLDSQWILWVITFFEKKKLKED